MAVHHTGQYQRGRPLCQVKTTVYVNNWANPLFLKIPFNFCLVRVTFVITMKLMERVSALMRTRHYARSTEKTYKYWIRHYVYFHRDDDGFRHPADLGAPDIEAFLTYLAVDRHVSASTQNQALNAIVSLYKQVLGIDPGRFDAPPARRPRNVPTVLSRSEVRDLLGEMKGLPRLITSVMYGGGLRNRLGRVELWRGGSR